MPTHQIRELNHAVAAVSAALVLLFTSAPSATARTAPSVGGHRASESSRFGEWIDDVEGPPEQYRDRPRHP